MQLFYCHSHLRWFVNIMDHITADHRIKEGILIGNFFDVAGPEINTSLTNCIFQGESIKLLAINPSSFYGKILIYLIL